MTEPIIYTKNYVNADDSIAVSHDDTFISRIYDGDKRSVWISDGANSDLTEVTIEVTFYEGDNAVDREVDTVILLNHNLKSPFIEYWDGNSWEDFANQSNLTDDNLLETTTPVTTSKMRVRCLTTQVTNAEKYIGELVFCAVQMNIGHDLVGYDPGTRQETRESKLANGVILRAVVKHSQYRSEKYEARAKLQYLTTDEMETLRRIKDAGKPFLWQPESVSRIDELYYVHWVGPFKWKYASTYKGSGVEINLDLKEV